MNNRETVVLQDIMGKEGIMLTNLMIEVKSSKYLEIKVVDSKEEQGVELIKVSMKWAMTNLKLRAKIDINIYINLRNLIIILRRNLTMWIKTKKKITRNGTQEYHIDKISSSYFDNGYNNYMC